MATLFYASASFILVGLTLQITIAENIAFYAHTASDGSYPEGKVLKFSNVLLNDGNGYKPGSGIFTAPVSGVYQFTAHACNSAEKYMVIAIMKGTQQIAVSTGSGDGSICNSVTTIAKVRKHENVYIVSAWYDSHMFSNDHRWPSFMGFLLYKI
ncbi:complement C1q tumor necrosis factor-related protein 2-like [Mercenaria mercenaria]|uniref:complement C1q tumor necrosis factor-related protein 2-like n=1 Tax=Mercenaria mercenaria TaxID=6596 RepID=UPI00234EE0E3|nr:complement C1q tumor necrosis factor-related protein 2-like [Mercenaria mercenaria]